VPFIDLHKIKDELKDLKGAYVRPIFFRPSYDKYSGDRDFLNVIINDSVSDYRNKVEDQLKEYFERIKNIVIYS